ncbi:MAG: N-acetylglucosamine-6-phosphate deacetylase [Maritimibacter sp.]
MSSSRKAYIGAEIFDGTTRHRDRALIVEGGRVSALLPERAPVPGVVVERLSGGLICPGFVDLQVNGGGGVMLNDEPSVDTLRRMAVAHARLGATSIMPTLITDTPDKTVAAIDAVEAAIAAGVPGILGLHLEGPHLSVSRKGAHDGGMIRAMTGADLEVLLDAAQRLPVLKLTISPESVSTDQIASLTRAGVLVSLGHSDASYAACDQAAAAGARCVTHLFNAMSQLTGREPGLVGAALAQGGLSAGLIADGHHVHPETIRLAMRAKAGPGQIFLVSDAMAVAGTDMSAFELGGRRILRRDGRLTLEDGTLAGADLDLLTAMRNLTRWGIADVDTALAMATSIPASLIGAAQGVGTLAPGAPADFLLIDPSGQAPAKVWQAGHAI